jgi:hypothetical protein
LEAEKLKSPQGEGIQEITKGEHGRLCSEMEAFFINLLKINEKSA